LYTRLPHFPTRRSSDLGTTGAHAPSTGNAVVVINPDSQSATCACTYTYGPAPAPTVTSISPVNGTSAGGTAVTITGTDFQAGSRDRKSTRLNSSHQIIS